MMKDSLVLKALAIFLAVVLIILALPSGAMSLSPDIQITLDPTPVEIDSGQPFTVNLKIEGIPESGMAAYDFTLVFTPGIIEFATNQNDHDWPHPEYGEPFAFNVDNAAGTISFLDWYLDSPAPSGDMTIAVMHGTALASGAATTEILFEKADTLDADGETFSATVVSGQVEIHGPAVSPVPHTITASLFDTIYIIDSSATGVVLETISATSEDGNLTLTLPAGTVALDRDGNSLSTLTVEYDPSPTAPTQGQHIIGTAYRFGPEGSCFSPPLTLHWKYDPVSVPQGVAEEDLVIAYYDVESGMWIGLDCVVNTTDNTITASASHFTTFAIIGTASPAVFNLDSLLISPPSAYAGEEISIIISVANTGGMAGTYKVILNINDTKEAEELVNVAAHSSRSVSFDVVREGVGSYTVTVDGLSGTFTITEAPVQGSTPSQGETPPVAEDGTASPVNWPLIVGIIGAVAVMGIVVLLLLRRKAF